MEKEKSSGSGKDQRTRNWTAIVYPESAVDGWKSILDELHVPWVCSPLHDKDVTALGEPKKAHYHIAFMFEGVKSYEQVKCITDQIAATIPQRVESARGMVRYMAHLDNPDKAQYSKDQIEAHGGVDITDYLQNTQANSRQILKDILQYIVENDVVEYEDILVYAMYNNDDWFDELRTNCTYVVNAFIKSRRHRRENEERSGK